MSVSTALKSTGRKIEAAVTGSEPDVDLLDTLKEEHEAVAALLKKLVESGRSAERKSLLAQIRANLVPHLKAEQKVLYDAIIAARDKKAQQDGHEGYMEHNLADRTLSRLEKMDNLTSPEFSAGAKVLKELVEHHVEEEEGNVWPDAKRQFPARERQVMNRRYLAAKKRVRVV